jgi:hypothetical protein
MVPMYCHIRVTIRGVNGDLIPVNPWGIPLLGLGYGNILIPMGISLEGILWVGGYGNGKAESEPDYPWVIFNQ